MARSNRNLQAIFQDTANAIRGKTGGSSSINPRDFADEIDSIPQDGGDEDFVERVANTLSRVNNSNVLSIGSYAFCSCNSLIEVSFPNCTRMSVGAFYGCSNLTSVNLSNLTSGIPERAFYNCQKLSDVNLGKTTAFGTSCFQGCSLLSSMDLRVITGMGSYAFYATGLKSVDIKSAPAAMYSSAFAGCSQLSFVSVPYISSFGYSAGYFFNGCAQLTSVFAPVIYSLPGGCFSNCTRLSILEAPFLRCCGDTCLYHCGFESLHLLALSSSAYGMSAMSSLREVYLGTCSGLNYGTFSYCSKLESIYILNKMSSVLQMGNYVFNSTPMSISTLLGYYGSIYVPQNMVETYKSATNWVAYSSRITELTSDVLSRFVIAYEFQSSTLTEIPVERINAEAILASAFRYCYSLNEVILSSCSFIGSCAFANCSSVSTIDLPICKYVDAYGFYSNAKATTLSLPECLCINHSAFQGCTSLTSLYLPKCQYLGIGAFNYCIRLSEVNAPHLECIGGPNSGAFGATFANCNALTKFKAPSLLILRGGELFSNALIGTLSFPKAFYLEVTNFNYCKKLSQLYLVGSEFAGFSPTIGGSVFYSTPMTNSTLLGYYGSIYVRASLLSKYQTAYGWSSVSARLVGVNNIYSTSATITNGSCLFDYDEMAENSTMEAQIIPDSGYAYPTSISVSGATFSYDDVTGIITLSNPTSLIEVVATCV